MKSYNASRRHNKKEEVKSNCLDSGFHSGTIISQAPTSLAASAAEDPDKKTMGRVMDVDSGLGIEYESSYSDLSVSETPVVEKTEEDEDDGKCKEQVLLGAQGVDSGLDITLSERFSQELNVCEERESALNRVELALKSAEELSEECNRHLSPALRHALVSQAFMPDVDGDTRLHLAVIDGRLDLVFSLIYLAPESHYLDMQNNLYQAAIHLAVLTGQPNMVRPLVLAGANLMQRDRLGDTALHIACRRGDLECVKQLTREVTPLEYHYLRVAMSPPHLPRRKPILQPSTIMDSHNYQGRSCVHLAAINKHSEILLWLKKFGANIDAKEGCGGRTPLTFAVETHDRRMVDFLVEECEANMDAENYAGLTAYQIAYQSDRRMADRLRSLGARAFYDDEDQDTESEDESMETCSSNIQPPPSPPTSEDGGKRHFYDLKINGEPLW